MRLPTTVKGRALAVDVANKHDGKLSYWDERVLEIEDEAMLRQLERHDHDDTLNAERLRSHSFPNCEACGAAVDDPEALSRCAAVQSEKGRQR